VKALLDAHRYTELGFVPLPAVRLAVERGWLYVAELDGAVAGTIDWWARRDRVVVLYNIAVSPERRGRGIGRALLQAMIDWAQALWGHVSDRSVLWKGSDFDGLRTIRPGHGQPARHLPERTRGARRGAPRHWTERAGVR